MQIWPAIDLRDGKCVRLVQGDYQREMIFGPDPAAMASRWVGEGAPALHLVDLDGARDGRLTNREAIRAIVRAVGEGIPCELGGGIRDEATIRELLAMGLSRLVLGTQALKRPEWFVQMCREFPGRLVLGIDAKGGQVATEGWLDVSQQRATDLVAQFAGEPVAAVVYTDIARDGMLEGPNFAAIEEFQRATELPLVASGGVTTVDDVRRLAALGVAGCIIGRTLYEGKLTLADALAAAATT